MALSNVAFMEANRKLAHEYYGGGGDGHDYNDRIVNGYVAHAQPWLASLAPLTHPNIVVCGGTLINSRYIMWVCQVSGDTGVKYHFCRSAAHCFCGSMKMVKENDGYCINELDDRLEHMYMWVTELFNENCV